MSASSESCLTALKEMSVHVDLELSRTLEERARGELAPMYDMLRYFMGYVDADFNPLTRESGKRFRPSLALLIAQGYGVRDKALAAAIAIELFHNFTLIHDDVEDHDEFRRNKPTVWKLWGINHAINSGDAQSLLASEWALRAGERAGKPELAHVLLSAFAEVIEGQYLDFELANASLDASNVNEQGYLRMIEKKSGVLVRVSAEAAGIAAGTSADDIKLLREYGTYLGMAYQMGDDYRSVWTTQETTGKDTCSDIREHKRTLPFFYAYAEAGEAKERLRELYSLERQLSEGEIQEVLAILTTTNSRSRVEGMVHEYAGRARKAARALAVNDDLKDLLEGVVDMLVPEGRESGAVLAMHPSIALA
jgi:geranylgeranyl diphosphate synthase type I